MKYLYNFKLFETQNLLDNTGITNENNYIYDDGIIHDSLLYDNGISADLDAYHNIRGELRVSVNKLPEEAQILIEEIDSFIAESRPKLREKILKLYSVLTGDNSLNEGATEKAAKRKDKKLEINEDKMDLMRKKVKDHVISQGCETRQVGNDLEVHLGKEHIAQIMFRKDYIGVKKEGNKFPKELGYDELGKVKTELSDIIKSCK